MEATEGRELGEDEGGVRIRGKTSLDWLEVNELGRISGVL